METRNGIKSNVEAVCELFPNCISEVQARYFIPALPLLLLLVRSKRITADIGNYTGKISFVSMMCLWAAVCYMVRMCY